MKNRRKAREVALQALYKYDVTKENFKDCLNDVLRFKNFNDEIINFSNRIIDTISKKINEIDENIKKYSKKWKFERIAVIDRNILRIAISEMLYMDDIPEKVSINEAVEIAKKFSTEESYAFINGILHRLFMDLNENE